MVNESRARECMPFADGRCATAAGKYGSQWRYNGAALRRGVEARRDQGEATGRLCSEQKSHAQVGRSPVALLLRRNLKSSRTVFDVNAGDVAPRRSASPAAGCLLPVPGSPMPEPFTSFHAFHPFSFFHFVSMGFSYGLLSGGGVGPSVSTRHPPVGSRVERPYRLHQGVHTCARLTSKTLHHNVARYFVH